MSDDFKTTIKLPTKESIKNILTGQERLTERGRFPGELHRFETGYECSKSGPNVTVFEVGNQGSKGIKSFDDMGVTDSNSLNANSTVTYFNTMITSDESGLPSSLPSMADENMISDELQTSSRHSSLYSGTLIFGFRPSSCTNRTFQRRVVRVTVPDLNRMMKKNIKAYINKQSTRIAAYSSVSNFLQCFYFFGVTSLVDSTAGDANTDSDCSHRQIVHTPKRVLMIDQIIKGSARVVNVWGNCNVCIESGVYLYLALRWVPFVDGEGHNCGDISNFSDIVSAEAIYNFSTDTTNVNNDRHWYLQLVPVACADDRVPYHTARSPNGDGKLFFIGRVMHNSSKNMHIIDHTLRSKYEDIILTSETEKSEIDSIEHCGVIEVAVGVGLQHDIN